MHKKQLLVKKNVIFKFLKNLFSFMYKEIKHNSRKYSYDDYKLGFCKLPILYTSDLERHNINKTSLKCYVLNVEMIFKIIFI